MNSSAGTASHSFSAEMLLEGVRRIADWQNQWEPFTVDETLEVEPHVFEAVFNDFTQRLQDNYPFFHPRYAGQMLKPPHPVAVLGYLTAMLINPNNHAMDGGPATAQMEKECIALLAKRFGFANPLGHLTSGGTMANLEALWVAREIHPDKAIAFSEQSHYTHSRMCDLLKVQGVKVPCTATGKMDLAALEAVLQNPDTPIGTVVVTLGTTPLGALDPLEEILALQARYGFRLHVDSAYGGFYHVLADVDPDFKEFQFVAQADSLVIDPHKHGLQPYGCGCVLFRDKQVGQFYKHDSPYTYFSSNELHLGEISLECSRPGAAAAALWLTLQLFPMLSYRGFGMILSKTRQAALDLAQGITDSSDFQLFLPPELDIVTYFPQGKNTAEISERSQALFTATMNNREQPIYLATLKVGSLQFHALHPEIPVNTDEVLILRSCLMKPEHWSWTSRLMDSLSNK